MSFKPTAIIKKELRTNPQNPKQIDFYASLALLNENNEEYGVPRLFSGFEEVAKLLDREAGVTYEQLQDHRARYDRGDEVRISLTLENEEAIKNLGFAAKPAQKE